jgi:hypothetical protein
MFYVETKNQAVRFSLTFFLTHNPDRTQLDTDWQLLSVPTVIAAAPLSREQRSTTHACSSWSGLTDSHKYFKHNLIMNN